MLNERIERWRGRAATPFAVDEAALAGERALREDEESENSVRVLSGIGGALSSLIFLLFLWLTDLLTRPVVSVVLGIVLFAVTLWLGRQRREAFLATITVCGFLVGTGLIVVGLPPDFSDPQLALTILALAAVTIAVTRNYYLVFLAVGSVPTALLYLHLVGEGTVWVWMAVALTAGALVAVTLFESYLIRSRRLAPARAAIGAGLLGSLLWFYWAEWVVPAGSLPEWPVVPFGGSLLLLLLSFRNQHALGTGLGVSGLIYFTAQYYYDLRWDLLDKSIILMVAGTLLLAAYFLLHRKTSPREIP